jgi:hypothetical protein
MDGPGGTDPFTQPAAFAFEGMDTPKTRFIDYNSVKTAVFRTYTAAGTKILVYGSDPCPFKNMLLQDVWFQDQVQIWGIHICITEYLFISDTR